MEVQEFKIQLFILTFFHLKLFFVLHGLSTGSFQSDFSPFFGAGLQTLVVLRVGLGKNNHSKIDDFRATYWGEGQDLCQHRRCKICSKTAKKNRRFVTFRRDLLGNFYEWPSRSLLKIDEVGLLSPSLRSLKTAMFSSKGSNSLGNIFPSFRNFSKLVNLDFWPVEIRDICWNHPTFSGQFQFVNKMRPPLIRHSLALQDWNLLGAFWTSQPGVFMGKGAICSWVPFLRMCFLAWRIIPVRKWLITIVSPLSRVVSLPNGQNGV